MLWVSEHGEIWRGESNRALPNGNLELAERSFASLLGLLDEQQHESPDIEPFFSYSRRGGREYLKVQNYVGVVSTSNGTQIEILPKLSKATTPESARELLVRMLVELQDSPFKEGTIAQLEAHKMPLFEIVFRYFLEQVADLVRKGIARAYSAHEDNLVYLRGKLQLKEHIRRNAFGSARCFCEFDEYEVDRPINRLLRSALGVVSRLCREEVNQQRCREMLFSFEHVPGSKNFRLDFQQMRHDRLIAHYAPAMPLCRLIIEGLNPLTRKGERKAISMLFPMEKVFEDFVAAKLTRQFKQWHVQTQVTGKALVESHIGHSIFNLRPDLELYRNGVRVIADTKWKLIDQQDRRNKYGIAQADVYQLFTYCSKYLSDQGVREVVLIYPASDSFREALRPFWFRKDDRVLHVVPYDLENEELLLPGESLLCDLPGTATG